MGQEAPHSFTYKQGCELTRPKHAQLAGSRSRRSLLLQTPVLILLADHHKRVTGEPHKVCCSHPTGKSKIDNYTKTKAELEDFGLKTAADALHALMHNWEYTLPDLLWLGCSWEVERAEATPSPHLPASSWGLFAGDALEVWDAVGLAWGLQV